MSNLAINFDIRFLLDAIGLGIFVWLCFYLLLRSEANLLTGLSSLALLTQALFFLSNGLVTASPTESLNITYHRLFWWDGYVPLAVWFHMSCLIRQQASNRLAADAGKPVLLLRWYRLLPPQTIVLYLMVIVCSVLASTTSQIMAFDHTALEAGTTNRYYTGSGPWFGLAFLFNFLAAAGAFVNFLWAFLLENRRRGQNSLFFSQRFLTFRWQLGLLTIGALFFWIASTYLTLIIWLDLGWSEELGYALIIVGILIFGGATVIYNTLLTGKDVGRDFLYSLSGIFILNVIYTGPLIWIIGVVSMQTLVMFYVLVILTTFCYLYIDRARLWLSNLFFSGQEQEQRREALAVAAEAGVTLVEINGNAPVVVTQSESEEDFNQMVTQALRNFTNSTRFSRSPLLEMELIRAKLQLYALPDTQLSRVKILQDVLVEYVNELAPNRNHEPDVTGRAWRSYNVLLYTCLKGMSKRDRDDALWSLKQAGRILDGAEAEQLQVLNWMNMVSSATLNRYQLAAINAIGERLLEAEKKLQVQTGVQPSY